MLVKIKGGVVYPPRGTGENIEMSIYVEHNGHDGNYPYEISGTLFLGGQYFIMDLTLL